MTDNSIVQELRAKNPRALSTMIDQFGPAVFALARRILAGTGTPEDIEECVSDVFVSAWNQADKYDEHRGSLRTWVLILTKFTALELRRKLIRQAALLRETEQQNVPDTEQSVLAEVLSRERQREIVESVRKMDANLREVFIRRYILHMSPVDIAGELGLSRGAVDNRLWRARKWLLEQLEDVHEGGGPLGVRTTTGQRP